jgi:hypothetical protein
MYETKKNLGRKDIYKYQKSSYNKNFHNSSHFGYNKYNKYKQKYNRSNTIQDYDEETIFSKIFEDHSKSTKKTDLKEVDELTPVPTLKACKTLNENKENINLNINTNESSTKIKSIDINAPNESNKNEILDNISSFSNSNNSCCCFNTFSDNLIIDDNFNKTEFEIKEEVINEINNNINNLNNLNFNNSGNINNINFNVDNAINDLLSLQNNNECLFTSNDKDSINLEYKKNIYKTPQSFRANSSSINISSNDMKEAYYIPKKQLNNIYDTHQPNNFLGRRNSFNHFNFMTTIKKPSLPLSNKQLNNYNLGLSNNDLNINYFKNNNNNNNNFLRFNNNNVNNNNNNNNNNNSNICSNFNLNIPGSPNIPINSFNLLDNSINNMPNIQQCLNHNHINNHNHSNNLHQNANNKNPFHNMMPQFELNQCILKTQINNNNLFEKDKENTDILEINVKIPEGDTLTFKIRRYDDMFKTVKIFCEINKLDIKLIRPFIIYIIRALNSVYGIYNLNLKSDEIQFLKDIRKNFYDEEEEKTNENNNQDNQDVSEGKDKGEKEDKNENNENENYEKSYDNIVDKKNNDGDSKEIDEDITNTDEEA